MADQPPEEKPETEDGAGEDEEVAAQKRVIRITADFLGMAGDVIREMRHREGDDTVPGEDEDPSLQEMCGVATVIITGKMSGIYAPKTESPRDFKSLLKNIETLVESKVSLALLKADPSCVPGVPPRTQSAVPLPPVPLYVPPPAAKSHLVEILERMYDRANRCNCHMDKDGTCVDCKNISSAIDVFGTFIAPEDKPASYDITCGCGGVMRVFWRQDHSRGIKCERCGAGDRPHATAAPQP